MQQTHKAPTLPTTQLKLTQILQLILQFLQQNNLPQSFKTLQQESQVRLNIINKQHLESMILDSKWELLFKELNYVTLSEETMFDLGELVVDDLIDRGAFHAAGFVVREMFGGRDYGGYRERVLRMEYICQHTQQKAMYHKPPTPSRRQNLINRILKQTHQEVQKSRLLTLITSALKFEASKGVIMPNLSYSILQGNCNSVESQMEQLITKTDKILRYSEETRVTCIRMSNKGDYIALGGIDGLIQIYEPIQYTLDTTTLKYQAQGIMLYHDNSIQHLTFNQTDQLLSTIDIKSTIKIWNMESGRLLRKIDYTTPVGCCCWGVDSSQLLIGYQNVQMFGVRGCNLLKEYMANTGTTGGMGMGMGEEYLMELVVSGSDMHGGRLFVFGQLGTIRCFNYKTQQQTNILHLQKSHLNPHPLKILPTKPDPTHTHSPLQFHICLSTSILTLNQKLQQISKYEITGSGDRIELINAAITHRYVYQCVRKEGGRVGLQVRDRGSLRVVFGRDLEGDVGIMEVHTRRNLLVVYGEGNLLTFWRP